MLKKQLADKVRLRKKKLSNISQDSDERIDMARVVSRPTTFNSTIWNEESKSDSLNKRRTTVTGFDTQAWKNHE